MIDIYIYISIGPHPPFFFKILDQPLRSVANIVSFYVQTAVDDVNQTRIITKNTLC